MTATTYRFRYPSQLLTLVALTMLSAGIVAQQRITISQLDDGVVATRAAAVDAGYIVDQRVMAGGTLAERARPGSYLYPIVRREGDLWEVQPAATVDATGVGWRAELELGAKAERARFEFRMVLSHSPLPIGRLPAEVLSRNTVAASEIVRLMRKVSAPVVWIQSIDGHVVLHVDGEVLNVGHQAAIEVNGLDLPVREGLGRARIAIAVQPVNPFSDWHWIMPDTIDAPPGLITSHFGVPRLHNHHRFRATAFVTWKMPPIGVPISSVEWLRVSQDFLAVSRPVDVWLWNGETTITHVDGTSVVPNTIILADAQAEVRGTLRRPLRTEGETGERVWLICMPREGDPQVAGWTTAPRNGGRWTIGPTQLREPVTSSVLDLVAIVSGADLTKVPPGDLRAIAYSARDRSTDRVRVRVMREPGRAGR
jgi:hypothetical protein